MENSPASSRDPSMDSTLTDGLTSNTGMGINILQKKKKGTKLKIILIRSLCVFKVYFHQQKSHFFSS